MSVHALFDNDKSSHELLCRIVQEDAKTHRKRVSIITPYNIQYLLHCNVNEPKSDKGKSKDSS